MTLYEQLASVDTEIKTLIERSRALSKQRYQIACAILIEEELLYGTSWELVVGFLGKLQLRYIGNRNDSAMSPISDLYSNSLHGSFALTEGINLQFANELVVLNFDCSQAIHLFAQKQNLLIVAPTIADKIKQLTQELATLELLNASFLPNLKV